MKSCQKHTCATTARKKHIWAPGFLIIKQLNYCVCMFWNDMSLSKPLVPPKSYFRIQLEVTGKWRWFIKPNKQNNHHKFILTYVVCNQLFNKRCHLTLLWLFFSTQYKQCGGGEPQMSNLWPALTSSYQFLFSESQ